MVLDPALQRRNLIVHQLCGSHSRTLCLDAISQVAGTSTGLTSPLGFPTLRTLTVSSPFEPKRRLWVDALRNIARKALDARLFSPVTSVSNPNHDTPVKASALLCSFKPTVGTPFSANEPTNPCLYINCFHIFESECTLKLDTRSRPSRPTLPSSRIMHLLTQVKACWHISSFHHTP